MGAGVAVLWRDSTTAFDMGGFSFAGFTSISNASDTSFRVNNADGSFVIIRGFGFTYGPSGPTGGIVTQFDFTGSNGHPQALISGASMPAQALWAFVESNDPFGLINTLLAGDDVIYGNSQNDDLFGGAGGDFVHGGQGSDTLDGGPGNDVVTGGQGDDLLVWRSQQNVGAHDRYDGGSGNDTLALVLTPAQLGSSAVQADLQAFQTFLSFGNAPGSTFTFSSLGLTVSAFEAFAVQVDPNTGPSIVAESTTATASLSELPNTTGSPDLRPASGVITFTDPDLGDRHFVSASDATFTWSGGTLNALQLQGLINQGNLELTLSDSTGSGNGSVAWTYTVADRALDFLAAGQTLTVSGQVTVWDGNGASATQTLTATIQGADDAPVFHGGAVVGSVTAPAASQISEVGAADLRAGNALVNGLGGTVGFGENVLPGNDDGSTGAIDIRGVFGSAGINFFGHNYTSLYLNNNGNLTFNGPSSSFTPTSITAGVGGPIIAPFWADVDTRGRSPGTSPGGNSRGSNLVYWDMDAANGVMTITWDDVAAYSTGTTPNAFQLQLINEGGGNFDIVYRYESITWLFGSASGGADARAGYNAQDGVHSFELPQSGTSAMLSLPTAAGNTDIPGVWVFNVRSGDVVSGTLGSTGTFSFDDVDLADVHTISWSPVGTTLGSLNAVISHDTTGTGSGGQVTWTYTVDSSAIAGLATRVESFDVTIDDQHGQHLTKRVDVTIVGADQAATISGATLGSVIENGGFGNSILGVPSATGTLTASDAHEGTSFRPLVNEAENYGTFTIGADGHWTYVLDQLNASVQALNVGDTLHDVVAVTTANGTTGHVDIVIHGANDAALILGDMTGWVVEAGGRNNTVPGVSVVTGALAAYDVDNPSTFVAQSNAAKAFGIFSITATGAWQYTINDLNGSVQALSTGQTLHDRFNVATADGTTQQMDITIAGVNDAAVITGDTTGTVVEASGVNNGTPGAPTATGSLQAIDVDSPPTFTPQDNVAEHYGTFSITSDGVWQYVLDDANPTVHALNVGDTLHDRFNVSTADGTTQQIDITIEGRDDAAVISGDTTGTVVEAGGLSNQPPGGPTTSGALHATDVDNPATFVAQNHVAKSYGTFSITADGAWTYTVDNNNATVEALNTGDTLHDVVTVATVDGTTRQIDIAIDGADDAGIDLGRLSPAKGFVIRGPDAGADAGRSVASAGDVNGDGIGDIIVGAPRAAEDLPLNPSSQPGEAYLLFGDGESLGAVDDSGMAVVDLAALTPDQGFVLRGSDAGDLIGWSVGRAGDVNQDGFADLILGNPTAGANNAGAAYVLFGKEAGFGALDASGRAVVDLGHLSSSHGFVIEGAAGDLAGWSVSTAGDLNDDGFDDMIIGAPYGGAGGDFSGQAYVVYGKQAGFGTIDGAGRAIVDLGNLASDDGFVIHGAAAGDQAGWSVSTAGDVNGDGISDLIVGAPFSSVGGTYVGEAYVIFGDGGGLGTTDGSGHAVVDLGSAAGLGSSQGFVIRGEASWGFASWSVSAAGDVNGDGIGDLIIGAPYSGGTIGGQAYVLYGSIAGFGALDASGRTVVDLANGASAFSPDQGFVITGADPRALAGLQVSGAGDVNGDGYADLLVGLPSATGDAQGAGKTYVIYGSANSPGALDNAGRAMVDLSSLGPTQGFVIQGDGAGDRSGFGVAAAGDVNGDDVDDLIVGAPYGDSGGTDSGQAYVLYGQSTGAGTRIVRVGNAYAIQSAGQSSGQSIKFAGSAVRAGQFGAWAPIAAEQTGSGYQIAWKEGSDDYYAIWSADSSGNYVSSSNGILSGSSWAFQSLESGFHQDLNGDGTVGLTSRLIESAGTTPFYQVAEFYSLGSPSGSRVKYAGVPVEVGEFGPWAPIAAERTASGYEIAWKSGGSDHYTVWNTDSNGTYLSSRLGDVSGRSWSFESLESSFHQDLNGDGTVGVVSRLIESTGATFLYQVAEFYSLGSPTGSLVKYAGAPVEAGQFGGWAPIAAEQTAGGYEIAWKAAGSDHYTVWNTDSNGTYLSSSVGDVSGRSWAFESLESSFNQDLNGDGTVGLASRLIESAGVTSFHQVAELYSLGGSSGPLVKYAGAPVEAGQFGAWAPIAAEQTASGYEIAWKAAGSDHYAVWNTDGSGNYLSSSVGDVSGSSRALQSLEGSFHQDLNGDGTIGIPVR